MQGNLDRLHLFLIAVERQHLPPDIDIRVLRASHQVENGSEGVASSDSTSVSSHGLIHFGKFTVLVLQTVINLRVVSGLSICGEIYQEFATMLNARRQTKQ